MKQFIKKLFGIDKIEKEIAEATMARDAAIKAEEIAKLSPKERATANKEPWVAVLDTHVNNENVRNGFLNLTGTSILCYNYVVLATQETQMRK